jgi:hypothetical protein
VTNDLLSCVLPVEGFPEINSRTFSSTHCEDAAQDSWKNSVWWSA